MNLLLLEPGERSLADSDPRARHIARVLRLGVGDELRAGEIGIDLGTARIRSFEAGRIHLEFTPTGPPPPLAHVELLLGHPRPIVLRRLLRDLAALGPSRIIVTPTALGEKSYAASNLWDDIRTPLIEGAAQGGTTLLPRVERAHSPGDALTRLATPPNAARLLLHPCSDAPPLIAALGRLSRGESARADDATPGGHAAPPARIMVAVGSERGWTDGEVALFEAAGFHCVSLGRRILRTETAAGVAVWATISWQEDGL